MTRHFLLFAFIFVLTLVSAQRSEFLLEYNWKFAKGSFSAAEEVSFDDSKWETVTVPHDWAIYGPFDKEIDKQTVAIVQNGEETATEKTGRTGALPYIGKAWYRHSFNLPQYKSGQKVLIHFEGAMSEPVVYLNGEKVGEWGYGYSYFYFDITDKIKPDGENLLAVQLTNRALSSRWYPGAGLYRNVRVIVKNQESINQWGTFIATPFVSSEMAKVNIKTKVFGENLRLVTHIKNQAGELVASGETTTLFGNEFDQNIAVENPTLWSPETPYLYTAT